MNFESNVLRNRYGSTLKDGNWRGIHNREIKDI